MDLSFFFSHTANIFVTFIVKYKMVDKYKRAWSKETGDKMDATNEQNTYVYKNKKRSTLTLV